MVCGAVRLPRAEAPQPLFLLPGGRPLLLGKSFGADIQAGGHPPLGRGRSRARKETS